MNRNPLRHVLFMAGFFWLMSSSALARQSETVIFEGINYQYRMVNGVERATAENVSIVQGKTSLWADHGTDNGDGTYLLRGNVKLVEEGDTILTELIRYDENTKIGVAEGRVRLSDGEIHLVAPFATYHSNGKRAVFDRGVAFSDSASVMTADRGEYLLDDEQAFFSGNVFLETEKNRVFADSLAMHRQEDRSEAFRRVAVIRLEEDSEEQSFLFADRMLRFESRDSTFVEGNVFVARSGEEDAGFIVSRTVQSYLQNGRELVVADDSVLVSGVDVAVRADSLVSLENDAGREESRFFGSPMAWMRDTQISADSLISRGQDSQIDSLLGFSNVFVASLDSSTAKIQQIRGRRLLARLKDDTLRTLRVMSNAEAMYYERLEDGGRLSATRASSDTVRISFVDGDIDIVALLGETEGKRYSENLFDLLTDLPGYIWIPEGRPDRAALQARFVELRAERIRESRSPDLMEELPNPWQ